MTNRPDTGAVSAGARAGHRPQPDLDLDRDRASRFERTDAPAGATTGRVSDAARDRQHDRFGGFSWGADFFGWLTAAGLTAILTGIASGAGAALALNEVGDRVSGGEAETIGLGGGIALLVILALAYFCGGYVAGRMARFDGARQGVGVWIVGIAIALLVAALAAVAGSEFNVLESLNLPRIPIDQGSLTTGGLIALGAALLVTLLSAIAGGKLGQRFHTKVDRVGA
jgi:MFS family permease